MTGEPKAGDTLRLYESQWPTGWGFTVYHVRAVLAEDEIVVLRHWNKRKQRWAYTCETFFMFSLLLKRDGLTPEQET